ncbi:MAG: hypothetical protein WC699_06895 [Bacteroidales bacterium]|jgi:peptidoglycan/xylan/chitin deacetylase (PgdA/CDA1 family)
MIFIENQPINRQANHQDFTVDAYRQLINLALASYQPADYQAIPWGQRFILWRHDCDYSLNRSLDLARIEADEGIKSTFFVNPHCEFYNLLESGQLALIKEIARLGHDIGLHFDATFYATALERELHEQVSREADLLEQFFGIRPAAFSFHNPSNFHLTCEAETYGGLVNCYSKRLKTEVSYCSDSNGYWRFRRLYDVLSDAKDSYLQVLTHPGWWQDKPMPPRQRIFRSAYGRAKATMGLYDQILETYRRENLAGAAQVINFLKPINPRLFELCDYLWNTEQFQALFIELWGLHESQIKALCNSMITMEWKIPDSEINVFFNESKLEIDGWQIFNVTFGVIWQQVTGHKDSDHLEWINVRNQLIRGGTTMEGFCLEDGCVYLCDVIKTVAKWGRKQHFHYDGLGYNSSIGIAKCGIADEVKKEEGEKIVDKNQQFIMQRWSEYKAVIRKVSDQNRLLLR